MTSTIPIPAVMLSALRLNGIVLRSCFFFDFFTLYPLLSGMLDSTGAAVLVEEATDDGTTAIGRISGGAGASVCFNC